MSTDNSKIDSKLVSVGRREEFTDSAVNPSIVRASTIVFETWDEKCHSDQNSLSNVANYGRSGTATTFAFREAICELENAAGCYVYPCGTAAITGSLQSFLGAGDHLLMVDTVYQPTRNFCRDTLGRCGVEVEYYDSLIGADIVELIRPNTKVIFMESPGSLTMEVQDVPAIAKVARQKGVISMIDNTYASPLHFKPLEVGVDISIHSATKYLSGHSDVMMGIASANAATWPTLCKYSHQIGHCASVDDIYTTLRGVRTLGVRMREHGANALKVAKWLSNHELVRTVLHPAFDSCPGHAEYQRDVQGNNGLFSIVMNRGDERAVQAMVDKMVHFKMGYSWGGYESLILPVLTFEDKRSLKTWPYAEPLIRLHIGLEDTDDLIDDLSHGLERYKAAC